MLVRLSLAFATFVVISALSGQSLTGHGAVTANCDAFTVRVARSKAVRVSAALNKKSAHRTPASQTGSLRAADPNRVIVATAK